LDRSVVRKPLCEIFILMGFVFRQLLPITLVVQVEPSTCLQ